MWRCSGRWRGNPGWGRTAMRRSANSCRRCRCRGGCSPGGGTWFQAPIAIGAEVRRISRIAAITPKSGRSGRMIFVTVRHGIESAGRECVVEEQDLVYREAATPGAAAPEAPPPELPADAVRETFHARHHAALPLLGRDL